MSGIFGAFAKNPNRNVFPMTYLGLSALQHRGQASMGIALLENGNVVEIKGVNNISENIDSNNISKMLGSKGIGHVKYAFKNESKSFLPMPWVYESKDGKSLIAIDGNFISLKFKMGELVEKLNESEEALIEYISNLKGAYSIVFVNEKNLVAIRDIYGIKPMIIGSCDDIYLASSESCAITSTGGEVLKELSPGEIFIANKDGHKFKNARALSNSLCLFEYVYTARPDSSFNGVNVYNSRYRAGELLFEENPVKSDIVMGAPDSGMIAALGFSNRSGISYNKALVRNKYIHRTFIIPTEELRHMGVKIKLSAIRELIKNRDVTLVDDSIVRGTTIKRIVEILRDAGANSIHIRVASPPVIKTDNLSIDVPDDSDLIANNKTCEQMRELINCDSLGFLSLEALRRACGDGNFYEKYFGGNDPIGGFDGL